MADTKRQREQALTDIFAQLCAQPASVVESETLEIKNWCSNEKQMGDKISESSACLANAHGGIVLVGIEDEDFRRDKFSKCPYPNVTPEWIEQRIEDSTVPPVEVCVIDASVLLQEVLSDRRPNCFAVFVSETKRAGGHQTVGGLSKIRRGKDCRPYYVAAEDDRSKVPLHLATKSDLDMRSISWGMQQHKKKFSVDKGQWEDEFDFLVHIGLVEREEVLDDQGINHRIALAGLLLFGTENALMRYCPGLETVVITPHETKRFRYNIVEIFRQLCGSQASLLTSLCPNLSERCIKELLMNAFVHRSYRHNSPIIIRILDGHIEFESPGSLSGSLTPESLLYCTPVYRNFLLAEGARYLGLCDKVGKGMNEIYESVLQRGLGFPTFENGENNFITRISTLGHAEFREFLKRRSQSLNQLDEIIVLRFLLDREEVTFRELCAVMQRGPQFAIKILNEMARKLMVEASSLNTEWRLSPVVRADITNIFREDQYNFGFGSLFGDR